jgi:hypothetical protein
VALLALLLVPGAAPAASNGVVEGRLTNATTGKPVGKVWVKLYWAKGQEPQPEKAVRADASGAYRFTGLPVGKEYAYVAYTVHQGVEYTTKRVTLTPEQPTRRDLALQVYNTTPNDDALHVKAASMVVLDVNRETQSMYVLETLVFENPTKLTFLPVVNGPRGPMGLLRFSLPPNASQLSPMGELASRQVIQTDRGFGTDLPIRPGQSEVSFTYQVPYRDPSGKLEFDLTMPYPTEEFRLMTPRGGPPIVSPDLTRGRSIELFQSPEDRYDVQVGNRLPARTKLTISATGLPVNVHFLRPDNPWLWSGTGALLLVLLGLALALWRRGGSATSTPDRVEEERAGLVGALAELDERYERGDLDEQKYRRERELRRQRLLALLAASPEAR